MKGMFTLEDFAAKIPSKNPFCLPWVTQHQIEAILPYGREPESCLRAEFSVPFCTSSATSRVENYAQVLSFQHNFVRERFYLRQVLQGRRGKHSCSQHFSYFKAANFARVN
jgi:hypothetical protein